MIRLPLTLTAVAVELALVVAGSGIAPAPLSRILAAPGYAVHLALSLVVPGVGFVVYALLFVGASIVADLAIHRTLQSRRLSDS